MPGRKPTPTALKLLKGNPGKRPLPENEPNPQGEVKKPVFVKHRATRIWKQYAPELEGRPDGLRPLTRIMQEI